LAAFSFLDHWQEGRGRDFGDHILEITNQSLRIGILTQIEPSKSSTSIRSRMVGYCEALLALIRIKAGRMIEAIIGPA
jgi:hypothetical protein